MLSVLHTLTGNEFVGLEVRRRLKKAAHVGRKVAIVILVVILLVFTRITVKVLSPSASFQARGSCEQYKCSHHLLNNRV